MVVFKHDKSKSEIRDFNTDSTAHAMRKPTTSPVDTRIQLVRICEHDIHNMVYVRRIQRTVSTANVLSARSIIAVFSSV